MPWIWPQTTSAEQAGVYGALTFDRKAEIVDTADGTLVTRKSLLKQSGKQFADDAEASIDNAKDAMKGLLQKNE